jgi:hypothetical protein
MPEVRNVGSIEDATEIDYFQDLRSAAIYSPFLTINLDIYTTSSTFT